MKIKDESRKKIVEAYQNQVREAIDKMVADDERMSSSKKIYIKNLEENIKRAPYILGYLEYPQKKK